MDGLGGWLGWVVEGNWLGGWYGWVFRAAGAGEGGEERGAGEGFDGLGVADDGVHEVGEEAESGAANDAEDGGGEEEGFFLGVGFFGVEARGVENGDSALFGDAGAAGDVEVLDFEKDGGVGVAALLEFPLEVVVVDLHFALFGEGAEVGVEEVFALGDFMVEVADFEGGGGKFGGKAVALEFEFGELAGDERDRADVGGLVGEGRGLEGGAGGIGGEFGVAFLEVLDAVSLGVDGHEALLALGVEVVGEAVNFLDGEFEGRGAIGLDDSLDGALGDGGVVLGSGDDEDFGIDDGDADGTSEGLESFDGIGGLGFVWGVGFRGAGFGGRNPARMEWLGGGLRRSPRWRASCMTRLDWMI